MYTPLEYIEQVKGYIKVFGVPEVLEQQVNDRFVSWSEDYMSKGDNFYDFVYDYCLYESRMEKIGKYPKVIQEKWGWLKKKIQDVTSTMYDEGPADEFEHLFITSLINTWKYSKLAYRVDRELGLSLANMSPCSDLPIKKLINIPSHCFYIDVSSFGREVLCEDMEGIFVVSMFYKEKLVVVLHTLVRGGNDRLIPITSRFMVNTDEEDLDNIVVNINNAADSTSITSEDNKTRLYLEHNVLNFYINFLLYLSANNKDVEKERKENKREGSIRKPTNRKQVKNKYKEIDMYNVGYRIVRKNKGVYSTKGKGSSSGNKTISPHFRSAHWHHYWVGKGEEKELQLRWVEEVYVGGKNESGVVALHEVN